MINKPYIKKRTCQKSNTRFSHLLAFLLFIFISPHVYSDEFTLTPEELAWLDQHPDIRLGVDPDWPPFDFVNHRDQHDGIAADYLRLLQDKLDIAPQLQKNLSWNDVLEKAKNKHIDVVSLAQKTTERSQYLSFTKPVISSPWVVISRKDSPKFTNLSDYENGLVAMVKGYAIIEVSKQHYPNLSIQTVDSTLDGLKAIATGEMDIFVENITIASHLIQTHGLINLKIAADAGFGLQELSFGVRSDWPELTSILDKGLASITQDEKKTIVNKWLAIADIENSASNDELSNPLWWSIGIGLITSLIVGLTIYLFITSRQERLIIQFGTSRFQQLSTLFIGIFVSAFLFVAWAALDYNKRNTIKKLTNTLETVRDTTTEGLVVWLDNRKEFLKHIAKEPQLIEITERLLGVPETPEAIKRTQALSDARQFFERTEGIYKTEGFFIINPNYISIASRRDSNIGTINLIAQQRPDLLERAFKGETVFIPPIYTDLAQSNDIAVSRTPATMFIAAPIKNTNGEVIAVVTQRLDPERQFSQMLRLGRIGETGETYAIDHKGLLISESRFAAQLRQFGLVSPDQNATLSLEIKDPLGNILQGHIPTTNRNELPLTTMAMSIGNKEEGTNTSGYADYRGVPVFGAWTWVDSLGIGITTEIDVEEGLDTYYSERKTIISALSISLLLSIGALMFTISVGTRSNRILKQSHDELEEKVLQRTADIQRAQQIEKDRVEVLERLMAGEALNDVMSFLIESVEKTNNSPIRCSILLLDSNTQRLRHCAAPNLPNYFNQAIDGIEIGSSVASYGAAAFNGKPVIIDDVISHPNWKPFIDIAQQANIRACWSYPIFSSNTNVLGTLSCYTDEPREPTNEEQEIIRSTVYLAGLAIEKMYSEIELVNARHIAEKANLAKSEFLSSMSHELRTPMNAIIGFGQLLSLDIEDETHKENIQEIVNAGNHLLTLINEILDLSAIESGNMTLKMEEINLRSLVNECISLINPLTQKQNIRIVNQTENCETPQIHADHSKLKQVLLNLLSNAVKYNRLEGKITVSCERQPGQQLRVTVSDTGLGLSEEKLGIIFAPFERAGAERSNIEGTGIGLVITKNLIEKMGGKIGVESKPGVGSSFWVDINLSEQDRSIPDENLKDVESNLMSPHPSSDKTVLYIEDNPANLRLIEKTIRSQTPYHFIYAQDATTGIELAESQNPDLILMDINLPDIDGHEAFRRLKNNLKTSQTPVIAVSANAMPQDIEKGSATGFNDYLSKPIDIESFLHCLRKHLE